MNNNLETNKNFISVDGKTIRNSYGMFFTIGETVGHDDIDAGVATIQSFECDIARNEIRVNTDKGYAHADFLTKL